MYDIICDGRLRNITGTNETFICNTMTQIYICNSGRGKNNQV